MKLIALLSLLAPMAGFAETPKFEMADVHVSPTSRNFAQNFGGVLRAGKYINRDATMLQLITAAYGIPEDDISGGPGWVSSDIFDIVAKVPQGTTNATAKQMLQALLAERFGLVVNKGTHPVPRYVLTVGKGSKLKAASGEGGGRCQPVGQPGGGTPGDPASVPNIKVTCRNLTSAAIAENLRQMAGGYITKEAVDQTKLEGSWDFDLEWTPRGALEAKGRDGISVFDAIDKQLGLKLELKDVPMETLSIEKVNRRPTANPTGIASELALAAARFEAATIKPADPKERPFQGLLYTGGSQMRAGGTLKFMIAIAMQLPPNVADDMVVGLPKSADTERWDINAKVPSTGEGAPNTSRGRPEPPPLSIGLEMLRGLLVDQFELKSHTENREVTVYALTTGSGKSKLTKADDTERSGCRPDPTAPKPAPSVGVMLSCKNVSMADMAQNLQQFAGGYIDHPIVDATGLEGGWNFLIGWTPRNALQGQQAPAPSGGGAVPEASDSTGISVFEAVEKQLGLKLVKQKKSIPVIVVDHVREKPVE
ncbi:MAG: hypothetical protein C5B56_07245 [Proteobacteria bacterium]|nr:MAG: hypothetical protein C5B56_07245 [Pseudomonadota bacterium]